MSKYSLFDSELRACRKCAPILASVQVDPKCSSVCVIPRPIVSGIRSKPILLIGQAPGICEYESGEPFQGGAGQKIRDIFREAGITDFDRLVYSSAVVKCYPGRKLRKAGGSEDRRPSTDMIRNCRRFLERELTLVDPQVIVTLGALPLKVYLQMANLDSKRHKLEQFVGTSHLWNNRLVVFFPHTSGGSFWLNKEENKIRFHKARQLLRTALVARRIVRA